MSPPAHDSLAAAMVLNGSVEPIFMYLERHKPGSPLPEGLFDDINPYQNKPSNLPVGILYLVNLSDKKDNAFGMWEITEEASEIFTNSSISGWRTTRQFHEYQESMDHETNWMMHEYNIILKKLSPTNNEKEARAICRVLTSAARSCNVEKHDKPKGYANVGRNIISTMASIFPSRNSKQGPTSESVDQKVVDGMELLSDAEKVVDPDVSEQHHMFNGDYFELDDLADPPLPACDYLELDDLAEPLSRSSSSDNSSLFSLTSDEYFDPNTLLQELEDNNNNSNNQEGTDASSQFSVTSSVGSC